MTIIFATAELAPLASTGGLGEVSADLPRALSRTGHAVSVFLPLYASVRARVGAVRLRARIRVPGIAGDVEVLSPPRGAGEPELLLIRHDGFFDRPGIYGDAHGDYGDSLERFAFFCRAVLEAVVALDLRADVLHANDWHTGLLGAYRRTLYRDVASLASTAVVFTIHNLAYQGRFPADRFAATGLPWEIFRFDQVEFYGQANLMKSGIVFADAVTTVSPRYAEEITTPEYGEGLDPVLRHHRGRLSGILNGIDVDRWNPETDPHLPARYGRRDLSGKTVCRQALCAEMGLDLPDGAPLLGAVTRLTGQKGCDLIVAAAADLLRLGSEAGAGLVLLGSGETGLEIAFRELAARHPGRVAVRIGFDEALAHRIEAGADIFLMPSRYEPCGLNQMYSLHYGTVPVVHACGGLDDTVRDYDQDRANGNGFKFQAPSRTALLRAVERAVGVWRDRPAWERLMRRGMSEDFSWQRSASRYGELYASLTRRRGSIGPG